MTPGGVNKPAPPRAATPTARDSAIAKTLLKWYRKNRRDLSWRRTRDPYRIWVSEIMLQQTRVAAVIPYYQRFLDRFPTVAALAAAPEQDLLAAWSGLGYYRRARQLQAAARTIVNEHEGKLPQTFESLRTLSGIRGQPPTRPLATTLSKTRNCLDQLGNLRQRQSPPEGPLSIRTSLTLSTIPALHRTIAIHVIPLTSNALTP